MPENGVKIPDATSVAQAQLTDLLAAARGAASIKLNLQQVADLIAGQGFLIGDPTYPYVTDQATGRKWQLGQKGIALPTTTSPDEATPDLEQSNVFQVQPTTTEFELQLPDNPPTMGELGIGASATMYFVIYARNSSDGSAGGLTFGSDYIKLPGSKPYQKAGINRTNIIHCWYSVTGKVYYRIDNTLPIAVEETESLTIAAGETTPDLLTSNIFTLILNGSDVEIINPTTIPYDGYEWSVYVSQTAGGDGLTINGTQIGNHVGIASGAGDISIIKFISIGPTIYYSVIPERQTAPAEFMEFDITIPAAEILTSNSTPLDFLTGTAAGKWIANLQFEAALVDGDTVFDTNTNLQFFRGNSTGNFIFDFDLGSTAVQRYNTAVVGANTLSNLQGFNGDSLRAETETGNPANGNYDLRVWGTYRILDS